MTASRVSNIPEPVNHFGRFYTLLSSSVPPMSEQHDRLRQARIAAGFQRQAEAARRFGFNPNTYKSNENGAMPFSYAAAQDYGRAFSVEAEWLYAGTGPMTAGDEVDDRQLVSIPIIDWVAAGQLTDNVSQLPPESETIEISGLPPGDYFGTKARGDSMNRVAPDDSLLIVNRADRELVRGRRYIFSSRGKTTFKRFGGKDPYRLEPESWNPANEPIYPRDGETWEVIGRVTMVIAEI